jgi:glycosyltransferase involved in cell wall biosynthesis
MDQTDGLYVYSINLLKELATLDKDSLYYILLRSDKDVLTFKKYPNVKTKVIRTSYNIFWDQIFVPLEARRVKADIIFNPKFSLPIFSQRPSVFVLQSSDWYINPKNYKWWDIFYIRLMLPIYSKKAKRLLSISNKIRDDLIKFAHIDPKKITPTYAAPSPHFFEFDDKNKLRSFAKKYKLPERFIVAVARIYHTGFGSMPEYPGGNIDGLLKGYRLYQKMGGNLPLVVAGKDIDKYMRNNNYKTEDFDNVFFTGFVPHKEMPLLYNLAEFLVLSTLYESFSFPIVEAMACGCPVIAPSTGACPEVAGGAAILVNPKNYVSIGKAMVKIGNSEDLRKKLRRSGLKRAVDFTWGNTAKSTLEVFDQIAPRY